VFVGGVEALSLTDLAERFEENHPRTAT